MEEVIERGVDRAIALFNAGSCSDAFAALLSLLHAAPESYRVQSMAIKMIKLAPNPTADMMLERWLEASRFGNLDNAAVILAEYFDDPKQIYALCGTLAAIAIRLGRTGAAPGLFANCLTEQLPEPTAETEVVDEYVARAGIYDVNPLHVVSAEDFLAFLGRNLPQGGGWTVVDAPCGSGQAAAGLRPWAARLIGSDLSPPMLDIARAGGGYDQLIQGDLAEVLPGLDADMLCCHGALYYFKDTAPVVKAAAATVKTGGYFAFNEHPAPRGVMATIDGNPRYCRSPDLVRELLAEHGFAEVATELGLTFGLPSQYWLFRKV